MDIENYYKILERLAVKINDSAVATHDFLNGELNNGNKDIKDLLDFRMDFIDEREIEKVSGYLIIGNFLNFNEMERITCFMMTFEIDEIKSKLGWKRRCENYDMSQPLFQKEPTLFNALRRRDNGVQDFELINNEAFAQINNSEILRINNSFTLIDSELNPLLYTWTKENFTDKPLYIRANPYKAYDDIPPQRIFESISMPANPNWWRNLSIYNRNKEGACYILDDCSPQENYRQYWELHIKKILRLEVIVKRNNNGNLSMMIEEITAIDNYGLRFGRMIHLDTDSPYGTDFENATLNHLDLAINVYEGENAVNRGNDNLASGDKTTDASFRTHLLRIENIPFKALFGFVTSFLKSQTLINLWLEDQFQMPPIESE